MAKYTFICTQCNYEFQLYTYIKEAKCSKCGKLCIRKMPKLGITNVTENIDKNTGTEWVKDQKELIEDRKNEYYWTVIVPRLVQQYSLETCLEKGWIYYDDKGQLKIRDKPPK